MQKKEEFAKILKNGTLVSENADYAEIGEWSDGNPDAEDRIGYFVSVDTSEPGKTMIKATSSSDVRGVTIKHPAFAANASADKYDADGNLLKQYDYVCFAGFAPLIDNGTCEVNGMCMPANDGTAIPSINNMGYQVIERIDSTHVLILVEPQADMMVRIKDIISRLSNEIANIPADTDGQPDWNQNDSTASDYVKNRTHYEEFAYRTYELNMDGVLIEGFSLPEVGETITVKINDVESVETVKEWESPEGKYKYIGNTDPNSLGGGGTGWCIVQFSVSQDIGVANPNTTITVKSTIVHKLDDKFVNFNGFVRTFDYYFKDYSIYKSLYNNDGGECVLYTGTDFILPETNSQLFGFMGGLGFSDVGSVDVNCCFINGYEIGYGTEGVYITYHPVVIGSDPVYMEELAAIYGFTHTTKPKA